MQFIYSALVLSTFKTDEIYFKISSKGPWAISNENILHTYEMLTWTNNGLSFFHINNLYSICTGCLQMRVREMRIQESASTLVSTENASREYASTENVGTKVLSQDNASTENVGTDYVVQLRGMENMSTENASTVDSLKSVCY
jgi:hypothetical protein